MRSKPQQSKFIANFLFFLVLGFLAVGASAQTLPATPVGIYLPYWYVDASTNGLLHLSQNSDTQMGSTAGSGQYPITVKVNLTVNGLTTQPPPFNIVVPPQGVVEVPLKAHLPAFTNVAQAGAGWGNGKMTNSAWGSITVSIPTGGNADDLNVIDAEVASVGLSGTHVLGLSKLSCWSEKTKRLETSSPFVCFEPK